MAESETGPEQGQENAADMAREIHEIHEMLSELLPLVRRAAPLLDSPIAKMANSPMGGVMSLMARGPRRG